MAFVYQLLCLWFRLSSSPLFPYHPAVTLCKSRAVGPGGQVVRGAAAHEKLDTEGLQPVGSRAQQLAVG